MPATSFDWDSAIVDLEARLYDYLQIPVRFSNAPSSGAAVAAAPDGIGSALSQLRRELYELRDEAARIGKIPEHYPRHIVLIMKAVSALLPWYTRPIVHFSQCATRTAEAVARLLDEVLRKQESLAMEVTELKKTATMPINGLQLRNQGNNGHSPGA